MNSTKHPKLQEPLNCAFFIWSSIPSRLVFVKINPVLQELCFYLCSFPKGTEPLSAPSWLNPPLCMICINTAFTSLKPLMNSWPLVTSRQLPIHIFFPFQSAKSLKIIALLYFPKHGFLYPKAARGDSVIKCHKSSSMNQHSTSACWRPLQGDGPNDN